jgi:hypothetical protein
MLVKIRADSWSHINQVCVELGAKMDRVGSKQRKVLLVEDDAELRLLTKTILEEAEFDIIECDSAEAPLATVLLWSR